MESKHFATLHFKLGIFLNHFSINCDQWFSNTSIDCYLSIKSDIPLGKGLGSSAAFNTVLSTSFLAIFTKTNLTQLTL